MVVVQSNCLLSLSLAHAHFHSQQHKPISAQFPVNCSRHTRFSFLVDGVCMYMHKCCVNLTRISNGGNGGNGSALG